MDENGECVATPVTPTTCGPGTVLQSDVCVVDTTAPPPVTGFAATVSGSNINLSWTAGTGVTSTLVARVPSGKYDAPATGVTYTVGMTLPGGSPVVAVGAGTTATDAITTPGRYTYLAFPQNASGNYGFGREASAVSLPAQTGVIAVDVAAGTVTVMTQPANLALAAADFAFDGGTGTLTFTLGATNNTAGHLFNVKAEVTSITGGTTPVVSETGTTAGGKPFVSLGFAALLPTEDTARTVTLTGIGATDTLTINVTLFESAMAVQGTDIIDLAGGPSVAPEIPSIHTPSNSVSPAFSGAAFSPSARYVYAITRYDTSFSRIDTTSGDVTSLAAVSEFGHGACEVTSDDGFVYVLYGLGRHRYGFGGQGGNGASTRIAVAKIDPGSLVTVAVARLDPENDLNVRACALAGTKLIATYGPSAYVLDTTTMKFIDTDATTADVIDPITVGVNEIRELAVSSDGTTVYTANRNGPDIYSINTSTYAAALYHTATAATNQVSSLTFAGGKLWWSGGNWNGGDAGLFSFDGTTEASVPNVTARVPAFGYIRGGTAAVTTVNGPGIIDLATGDMTWTGTFTQGFRAGHRLFVAPTP